MTADKIKLLLNLVPLSIEGGYYAETYRSPEMISPECLHGRYISHSAPSPRRMPSVSRVMMR
jgi:predicted cupin superfamily sugar epimerase